MFYDFISGRVLLYKDKALIPWTLKHKRKFHYYANTYWKHVKHSEYIELLAQINEHN